MRIIGGVARGRTLKSPKGKGTRPTGDRVKETIFNVLGQRCDEVNVLDLFAGTGALGLEAVSRGAAKAVLVESHREVASLCLENARMLGFESKVEVLSLPVAKALERLAKEGRQFQLVFSDPPYAARAGLHVLQAAVAVTSVGGLAVLEHEEGEVLPVRHDRWVRQDERAFGDTVVSIFRLTDSLA